MKRTYFPPGQEPKVLTSISEQCQKGECEKWSDIFRLPGMATGKSSVFMSVT